MTSRIFLALVTALFTLGAPWALRAQDYPNRPVTLVVPWPAGGTTDIGMRALASATERYLKQKIIIENRPGASGVLGARCPLIPLKRKSLSTIGMCALGRKQTFCDASSMSALPPKATSDAFFQLSALGQKRISALQEMVS